MKRLAAVPSGQDLPIRKEHPWTDAGRYGYNGPTRIAHDEVELRHILALEAFKESENGSHDDPGKDGVEDEPPSGYQVTPYSADVVDAWDRMTSAWAKGSK